MTLGPVLIAAAAVVALAGCTTVTEIVEIECDVMVAHLDSAFVKGSVALPDSVTFDECDREAWDGLVVRRS